MSNEVTDAIDKYYPAARLQKEILGEKWAIQGDEYISVVRGTLCSIPVVGAMVDCFFGIYWNKLYPDPNPVIRKEELDKRLNELVKDIENKINSKINEEVLAQSKLKFESLGQACFAFSGAESMYLEDMKQNKVVSQNVKTYMIAQYSVLKQLFIECIIFFSRKDHFHSLVNIYFETVSLYVAFLRDVYFHGKEWSLPDYIIDGTSDGKVKPILNTIQDTIKRTLEIIKEFRTFRCISENNYQLITKQLVFSDMKLYPLQQVNLPTKDDPAYWKKEDQEQNMEFQDIRIPKDTTDKIFTLQWDSKKYWEGLKQYITLPGIKPSRKQEFLLCTRGSKNLQFRFSALLKPGIHYKIKVGYHGESQTLIDEDFKYDNEKDKELIYPSSLGDVKYFKTQRKINIDKNIFVSLMDFSENVEDKNGDTYITIPNAPKSGFLSLEIIDTKN